MAYIGSFPTSPGFQSVRLNINTTTTNTTALSGRRIRSAVGTTVWSATGVFPPMTTTEFRPIFAFITQARGSLNSFDVVFPEVSYSSMTSKTHTITVASDTVGGSTEIPVTATTSDGDEIVKVGDMIRFSNHSKVYMVQETLIEDSAGTQYMKITPGLVQGISSGNTITYDAVPFRMTLERDVQEINVGTEQFYRYEIDFVEEI